MNQPEGSPEDRGLSDRAEPRDPQELSFGESPPQCTHFAQHFPGLAWIKNRQGRYVYANAAARQVFGPAWPEVIGKTDAELFPARAAAEFRANDQKVIIGKAAIETIEELEQADGLHRSLVSKFPIFGVDGEVLLVGGMAIDITDQLRIQAELHQKQNQLQLIADHAPLSIAYFDAKQRYRFVNKAYAEQLGLSTADIIGKHVNDVLGPVAYARITPYIDRVLSGQTVEFHLELPFETLGMRFVQVVYVPDPAVEGVRGWVALVTDVTERHRFETALRDSEERLRLATQTGKLGVWDWDITTNRVTWSDSLYSIHGVRRDQFDGTVEGFQSFIHPDDHAKVTQAIESTLNEGMPYELEFRALRPDGTVIWLFTNAAMFRDGDKPMRLVGATFDITERKQTEAALRHTESLYRTLLEQAHDAIYVCDPTGRIVMANELACRLLGYSRDELLSLSIRDTYEPDKRHLFDQRFAEARQGKVLSFERKMVRKDGSSFEAEVVVTMLDHGQGYATARDVTRRKEAEAVALKRAERTGLLSETLAQLLSARDPDTIVRELFPKVAAHLNVDTYFNFMVDETGQALRLHSHAGLPEHVVRSFERLEFGQAICGTVAQHRERIIANDIQNSDYDKAALVRGFGIQTYACHPLMAGGQLLGTLSFASRTRSSFDADEIEFIRIISQYTAVALDRLRTTKALNEHTRSLEIVNRVGTTLAAELDLNKLVQAVTDAGREVSGAEFGAFFYNVQGAEGQSYQLFTLSGASREAFEGFGMPRNTPVFGPTFRGEAPIRVPDMLTDSRYGTMAPHHGMPEGHLPVRS